MEDISEKLEGDNLFLYLEKLHASLEAYTWTH